MSTFRHKYKPINGSDDHKDIPLVTVNEKPPVRKIRKCHPSVLAELRRNEKLQASHPRFGPFYREDEPEVSGKKEAWNKILEKSEDKNKTIESYLFAMRRIEKRARATYAADGDGDGGGALRNLTESQFRWMMIEDGCFFLQLTLFILGVSSRQLGYPENHIIFGKKQNIEDVKKWIESMFFVGNQVPLVVLTELMKQSFFLTIILNKMNWEIPSDLPKRILYELLVLPALEYTSSYQIIRSLTPPDHGQQHPSDLLHALHSMMLGPGGSSRNADLVEDETRDGDLEAGRVIDEAKDLTYSATELQKKGILFWKVKDVGFTGKIRFKDNIFFPRLYLPVFHVDDDTELVFKSLKYYETSQQQGKGTKCYEACSYLQFMSDLICTYDDVKLLAKKGIIKANNPYYKEKLPTMLSKLAGKNMKNMTTQDFRLLRIQLRDYNMSPWEKFKILAILLFILTFVQTFFAMLAYFRPPPPK